MMTVIMACQETFLLIYWQRKLVTSFIKLHHMFIDYIKQVFHVLTRVIQVTYGTFKRLIDLFTCGLYIILAIHKDSQLVSYHV